MGSTLVLAPRPREFRPGKGFFAAPQGLAAALDRLTLGGGSGFRIKGNVTTFGGGGQYGGKFHHVTSMIK